VISVVNGYVCFSCCDEAKAKRGENPHKPLGALDDPAVKEPGQPQASNPARRDAAVTFGGALADANAATAAASTAQPALSPQNLIDVLA
jgi:hypothetical protein